MGYSEIACTVIRTYWNTLTKMIENCGFLPTHVCTDTYRVYSAGCFYPLSTFMFASAMPKGSLPFKAQGLNMLKT